MGESSDMHDEFFNYEYITAKELAKRLGLKESTIRQHTRSRAKDRIPAWRDGKYVRFLWGSPKLANWIKKHFSC
jgi:excisionase family DNA binding protein